MKTFTAYLGVLTVLTVGGLTGCSSMASKSPDVSETVRKNLDVSGLKDVTVNEDVDKGVVTLGGHVAYDADKAQAETIAKSSAGSQVVANEIAVVPPGIADETKKANSDLDKGIEKNLEAAYIMAKLDKDVNRDVKNGVVKLTGEVNSPARRKLAESIATKVPNVQQVVNELDVKNQKATSSSN